MLLIFLKKFDYKWKIFFIFQFSKSLYLIESTILNSLCSWFQYLYCNGCWQVDILSIDKITSTKLHVVGTYGCHYNKYLSILMLINKHN